MDIEKLYNKIQNGSEKEARESAKKLKDYFYKSNNRKKNESIVKKIIGDFDKIKIINQPAAISVLYWPVFSFGDKYSDILQDFIIENVQHKSGQVRHQIKFLTEYYLMSLKGLRRNDKNSDRKTLDLIRKLLELSNKYRKEEEWEDSCYIEDLKPSVYKTLQIILEEIFLYKDYYNKLAKKNDIKINFDFFYGEDSPNIILDRKPGNYEYPEIEDSTLNDLYRLSVERFKEEAARLGVSKNDFNILILKLANPDEDHLNSVFTDFMLSILEKNKIKDYNEFNGFVREFQGVSNHYPIQIRDKEKASRYAFNIQRIKLEYGYKKPENMTDYLKLCYKAHKAVDNFFEDKEQRLWKIYKKTNEFMKKAGIEGELTTKKELKTDYRVISICHHILDWYLQEECNSAQKKSPEKLAMGAVHFVDKLNNILTDFKTNFTHNDEVAKFGGWKSSGSISSVMHSFFYSVIYKLRDIDLAIIDQGLLAKDWRKKLKKIAPALKMD